MTRNEFARCYIEAALFADTPEDARNADLSADARAKLESIASAFYDANSADIAEYGDTDSNAGHDLWYTQNGHGCGYWEHSRTLPAAVRLDEAAKRLGTVDIYLGDDGELHAA